MPRHELAISVSAKLSFCCLTLVHDKYLWAVAVGWLGFAAAAAGEPVIFSAMGCGPYTPPDKPAIVRQQENRNASGVMVHLGDVFAPP